jgi:hypothetical protein
MFKKTSLALLVSVSFGASAGSVNLDGHFGSDDDYDKVFAINYYNSEDPGSAPITGGVLALATDGDKQYVYISHPIGFKDLSYGEDDKYTVGWGEGGGSGKKGANSGQKNLDNAIKSEFIALQLEREGGSSVYGVTFNPNPPSKGVNQIGEYKQTDSGSTIKDAGGNYDIGDGIYTTDDGEVNIRYLSTADYNRTQATDYNGDTVSWFESHSPETEDCGNESSSDDACYNIANLPENYIDTTDDGLDNPTLIKWDFNWGLEIELDVIEADGEPDELFFGALASIGLEAFGYQSDDHIISLDALHASKPKVDSCPSANNEPCDAEVVPDDSTSVPEPSTFAIFSLALVGLWARKRRSPNK